MDITTMKVHKGLKSWVRSGHSSVQRWLTGH